MRRHEQLATLHLVLELPHRRIALSSLSLLSVYCSTALISASASFPSDPFAISFLPCSNADHRAVNLDRRQYSVQMGAPQEGQTEEEKHKYVAGLKEIINDLRRDKVKDFNTVASEIAAYRRRFLQDPSRVLSL